MFVISFVDRVTRHILKCSMARILLSLVAAAVAGILLSSAPCQAAPGIISRTRRAPGELR